MADFNDLAKLMFPDVTETVEDLEKRYPARNLPEGAQVTRFAPSPTGFLHTGSLFTALVGYKYAKQSGGVYMFRLEDTDTKRTIAGSGDELIDQLGNFGIVADEGYWPDADRGNYGPYQQSKRRGIYRTVIKHLVEQGKAYPDFCTAEDLEKIRAYQEANKILPGYYGEFARDRNLPIDEQIARIKAGEPYVVRFKSFGDHNNKVSFVDAIRGKLEIAENDVDVVILKGDGLPTYHFAHAVDDHFMRTTLVSRGEEWIPSTPIHLDLFTSLGWEVPQYAHLPVIMKLDNGNKRKLSKRKDPEAAVSYFLQEGYPTKGLLVYLMNIANSNFEDWTIANKDFDLSHFKFTFEKMSLDGALFDIDKLQYFCREVLGAEHADTIVPAAKAWAKEHNEKLYNKIVADESYISRIVNIDKDKPNPRKDFANYAEIETKTRFFFDEDFQEIKANPLPFNEKFDADFIRSFLKEAADNMIYGVDEMTWWNGLKDLAAKNGFATNNKEYKANPTAFKGNVADAAELVRVALTGSKMAPNLHEVIEILGIERVKSRLTAAI